MSLHDEIAAVIRQRPAEEWCAVITQSGGFCARVREVEEAWADPILRERGRLVELAGLDFPVPVVSLTQGIAAVSRGPRLGEHNVASLSSYGTFQIRSLLKDLGRIYGLDHADINKLNRSIDKELKVLYKDQDKSTLVIKLEDILKPGITERFAGERPAWAQVGSLGHSSVGLAACDV